MNRDIPYDLDLMCDSCGKIGAFDFMGDYFCADCTKSCTDCGKVIITTPEEPVYCIDCNQKKKK